MLKQYFENKIGQKIQHSIITGKTFFTEVYKRTYNIEVLAVQDDILHVEVSSFDSAPSGFKEGGSDKRFGEVSIQIGNKSKTEIINEIINNVDRKFLNEYNIKAI